MKNINEENMAELSKLAHSQFKDKFPSAPDEEIAQMIQTVGETVTLEVLATILDAISLEDVALASQVKEMMMQDEEKAFLRIVELADRFNINVPSLMAEIGRKVINDALTS